jgi:type II secretory ATPase GspE/PulE/Tfp pilus assembly ATPase PilB-like protein
MGIPPFLIAFTANIIIAQRLVRKICEHCKKEIKLTKSVLDELAKFADIKKLDSSAFYHGEGCHRCNNSGYKGRIGIYEVMEVNEKISSQINNRANADVIKKIARENGMATMFEDGIAKAQQGITTIEEILRVTKE